MAPKIKVLSEELSELLAHLPGFEESSDDSYKAFCPAHKDTNTKSLAIKETEGKILVHCFGKKCSPEKIMDALGMEVADLFVKNKQTYTYTDEKGKPLYQIVKTYKDGVKDYYKRHIGPNGEWVKGMKGVQTTLYNLPNVIKAVKEGKTIYITEGEKDANNVNEMGLVATTSGGAQTWESRYKMILKGAKKVIILPDNNEPGRKYARTIAQDLYGAVKVKVVKLPVPEGEDVSNWIIKGGKKEELLDFVKTTKYWKPTPENLAEGGKADDRELQLIGMDTIAVKSTDWLIWPYLPRGEITLLEGDTGSAKTFVMLALAAGLTGSKICPVPYDNTVKTDCKVVIVTAEDPADKVLRPRLEVMEATLKNIKILSIGKEDMEGITAEYIEKAEQMILDENPDLILIDSVSHYASGDAKYQSDKSESVMRLFNPLKRIARRTNCSILMTRHFRKESGKAIHRGGGSVAHGATSRSMLTVARDKNDKTQFILAQAKINYAEKGPALSFKLVSTGRNSQPKFEWLGTIDISADELTDYRNEKGEDQKDEEDTTRDIAAFLHEELFEGPVEAPELYKRGLSLKYKEKPMQKAAHLIGKYYPGLKVVIEKQKSFQGKWIWRLEGTETTEETDISVKKGEDHEYNFTKKKDSTNIRIKLDDSKKKQKRRKKGEEDDE